MYADEDELKRKKKQTAAIVCLIAGAIIIVAAVMPGWIKSDKRIGMKSSLYGFEWCAPGAPDLTKKPDDFADRSDAECQKVSNSQFAQWMRWQNLEASTLFGPLGFAVLALSILTGLALAAAGGLGLKDRFVRSPVALTTLGLVGACLALVAACVWVATKPGHIPRLGPILGLSWPFFLYGTGILTGIVGAQMLAKAHSDVRDPYWDGLVPEPGLAPMQDPDQQP